MFDSSHPTHPFCCENAADGAGCTSECEHLQYLRGRGEEAATIVARIAVEWRNHQAGCGRGTVAIDLATAKALDEAVGYVFPD
jgi:hypothetical protein